MNPLRILAHARHAAASSLLALTLLSAHAAADPVEKNDPKRVDFGGDVRVRQVHFDSIPSFTDPPGVARGGENHFFRFRTRLWSRVSPGPNLKVFGRIANEFRHYESPDVTSWDFPDETFLDNLYIDLLNCFGETVDLRIGRQDLKYGNRRVISEGSVKDGSRSIYMDAVKLTYKGLDKNSIDLLGIYNSAENELAVNSQDRDLTGYTGNDAGMDEGGGGVYWKNNAIASLPFEAYYLFKHETAWKNPDGELQPSADVHTLGSRWMPRFNEHWDANLEVALQTGEAGDADQSGVMVDALLNYHPSLLARLDPTLTGGLYYLSGDDPESQKDEGWNPLWSRWVQYSELYFYAWGDRARWSNLVMPHLDFSLKPNDKLRIWGVLGALLAEEDDGPGPGDYRGTLGRVRTDFTLKEDLWIPKDSLVGHLSLELFDPGDYYNVDDTAHWARWELSYQF